YPFVYSVQIIPEGTPSVVSVEPPGANHFDPSNDVVLGIQLSSAPYFNNQSVDAFNSEPVRQAFYLQDVSSSTVVTPNALEPTETATYWRIIFKAPQGGLWPSKTKWQLKMKPAGLTDATSKNIVMPASYFYRIMDSTCNGFGTYAKGVCFC